MTFSYPTRLDEKLFLHVTLAVEAGQRVAFSGASGCGKSSFIGLVQRMYDPIEGNVFVDGVDLKDIDLDWWRSQLGVVSQEPHLFSGTIRDNITIGKPDATDDDVVDACKKANIHATIMSLPDKYNTNVGAVGSQLSGGQKQRIAIARALIRKPKVLILDEATSALDRQSEIEVQAAIDKLMRGDDGTKLTILVIAHRLATIRNVDKIFFIEHDSVTGSVISESGTYDELIAKGGAFAQMASRQSKSMGTLEGAKEEDDDLAAEYAERKRTESVDLEKLIPKDPNEAKKVDALKAALDKELEEVDASMTRVYNMMPSKWPVYLGIFGSMLAGGVYPTYSVVLAKVLEIIGQNTAEGIREHIPLWASMFVVVAAGAFFGWTLQGFYGVAGEQLTVVLRRDAFRAILRQDMTFFDMPGRDCGSLQSLLSGDCEHVHQLWGPSIGTKVQAGCNLATALAIGFAYSWKLALVTLSTMPFLVGTGAIQQYMVQGFGTASG
jgi:ATP-binding cassette subfamily B (MDR/TAP) protein 1